MNMLFDDPTFLKKEEDLKRRDPEKYDAPEEAENYSLLASNEDPAVKAAKSLTHKRRTKLKSDLIMRKGVESRTVSLVWLSALIISLHVCLCIIMSTRLLM